MKAGFPLFFPPEWNVLKSIQKETETLTSRELAHPKPARKTRASRNRERGMVWMS